MIIKDTQLCTHPYLTSSSPVYSDLIFAVCPHCYSDAYMTLTAPSSLNTLPLRLTCIADDSIFLRYPPSLLSKKARRTGTGL